MPPIAARHHVIAVDLPGFDGSDKPSDVRYGFSFFSAALDGFLTALGIDSVSLVGHDLGGPVALHWALHHRDRLRSVALLNTLVYPEFSDAVVEFVTTLNDPSQRDSLTGPDGLRSIMGLGVVDEGVLTDDVLKAVLDPFPDEASRLALANVEVTALPDCGHFVQEEQPGRVGELLAAFLASSSN